MRFRGVRFLVHKIHHPTEGFGWMFLPFTTKAVAWFPSTRNERPCAFDHNDQPIVRASRWLIVATEHGRDLHDCTKSGVF